MNPKPALALPSEDPGGSGVEALQRRTIQMFVWVLLLLVTPILAGLHLTEAIAGRYDLALAAQGIAHGATCVLILVVRRLRGRALVAIAVLSFSATLVLLHYGPSFGAGLLFFTTVLLGTMFFGWRAAAVILALVAASILGVGAFRVRAGATMFDPRVTDPLLMSTWIRTALVGVPVLAVLAALVGQFLDGLQRSVRTAERALQRERAERAEKERMDEARRTAERALAEAQRQQLIGRLAAGASHDLNNVLTAILGAVELATLELEASNDAAVKAMLELVEASARRASAMGRQLLSFSRQQHTQPRNVDCVDLIAGMRALLLRLLPSSVALETAVDEEVVPVFADPHQLEQMIMNLVVNARDAMPDGGRVSVRVCAAASGAGAPGVRISVEDTGTGIPADVREKMFDPFFTTKEGGRGTGLGLATVKNIVEEYRGTIDVESEAGRGAAFHVWLPASDRPEATAAPERSPGSERRRGGGERLLLADDDPAIRAVSSRILTGAGYQVDTVSDGHQVLEKLELGGYDLLILDAVMPGPSGSRLVQQLESRFTGIQILFSTGYDPGVFGLGFFADPRRRLLSKPYRRAELLAAVLEALESRAP
jgi:signal transduction histidine kinase